MGAPGGPEEIVLDINLVGKGKSYCHVGSVEISPDHNVVAYAADYNGSGTCLNTRAFDLVSTDVRSVVFVLVLIGAYGGTDWGARWDTRSTDCGVQRY
eukprot:2722632-Rhodomonas_salina.1